MENENNYIYCIFSGKTALKFEITLDPSVKYST